MEQQIIPTAPVFKYYLFQVYLGNNKFLADSIVQRAKELNMSRSEYIKRTVELELVTKTLNQTLR